MVNFLKKRLQVFVSSTYLDLKTERQAAVSAILTSGHIPAGMELFTAGDQSQMEVIKQWIDESDVFLLILGSRYGSIESETKKSYTHLEYEYALSKNKPLFACVIKDSAIDERVTKLGRNCLELKNPQKLKDFRDLVLSKMSGFWSDTKDIKLEVINTLNTFSRREDLIGWVKGDESLDTVALTEELARLSKENAKLREQNQILTTQLNGYKDSSSLGINFDKMQFILKSKKIDNTYLQKKIEYPDYIINIEEYEGTEFTFEDFLIEEIKIKVEQLAAIDNQLELFKLLRKSLSMKLYLDNSGYNMNTKKILSLIEILIMHGIVLVNRGLKTCQIYLSESGLQFSNWLDVQQIQE